MIRPCLTEDDFRQLLAHSSEKPVFLLKHSTRCPVSAGAHTRFERFSDEHPEVECWQVLVIENRSLSNLIADETGITHASPQAILLKDGKACWHTSHGAIAGPILLEALEKC